VEVISDEAEKPKADLTQKQIEFNRKAMESRRRQARAVFEKQRPFTPINDDHCRVIKLKPGEGGAVGNKW
jgi:hypothetical protein